MLKPRLIRPSASHRISKCLNILRLRQLVHNEILLQAATKRKVKRHVLCLSIRIALMLKPRPIRPSASHRISKCLNTRGSRQLICKDILLQAATKRKIKRYVLCLSIRIAFMLKPRLIRPSALHRISKCLNILGSRQLVGLGPRFAT